MLVIYYKLYVHYTLYNYIYVRTIKNKHVKLGVQVLVPGNQATVVCSLSYSYLLATIIIINRFTGVNASN